MSFSIGLVGPKDTVELVLDVANNDFFPGTIKPFLYSDIMEVEQILQTVTERIDLWFFTGRVAYNIAKKANIHRPIQYVRTSGTALMNVLFQIYRERKKEDDSLRCSIDTLKPYEVFETLIEMNVPTEHVVFFDQRQKEYGQTDELIQFHEEQYKQGLVELCITHRSFVYEQLKRRNIPVYRIQPTRAAIRQALQLAIQTSETNQFKKSQIAVFELSVHHGSKPEPSSYKAYRLDLQVQEVILTYAESISGSFMPIGNGKFLIFSTRGALEADVAFPPLALLNQIQLMTSSNVTLGIGYGLTALGAQHNASLALHHADQAKQSCVAVVVDEKGTITGPYSHENKQVKYPYLSIDAQVVEQLKQENINVASFHRFLAVQDNIGKEGVTAADLAKWLNMTTRNANRILADLEKAGLAKVIGAEAPIKRGRPRKLFRLGQPDTLK